MGAAKKTASKAKLATYERIRDLDAQAKAWAKDREEPVTAETYAEMARSERDA